MGEFATTHQFLRSQTAEAHQDVEKFSPLSSIIDESMADPVSYGNILLDFAELLDAFEARTALEFFRVHENLDSPHVSSGQLRAGLFLERRQLLQCDLRALGLSARRIREPIAKMVLELEQLGTPGWFGAAYVLQGQTLGATLIYRALQACPIKQLLEKLPCSAGVLSGDSNDEQAPTPHARPPFLFFSGHALKTTVFWSEFLRTLEVAVPVGQSAALQQALAGALKVFHAFLVVWKRREESGFEAT